ncbi:MAG: hypothetical protein FJ138_09700 [Deltaproteobacteria bacterium]|nr:hypothetical protein [Deltaproteobacteria bacterium]
MTLFDMMLVFYVTSAEEAEDWHEILYELGRADGGLLFTSQIPPVVDLSLAPTFEPILREGLDADAERLGIDTADFHVCSHPELFESCARHHKQLAQTDEPVELRPRLPNGLRGTIYIEQVVALCLHEGVPCAYYVYMGLERSDAEADGVAAIVLAPELTHVVLATLGRHIGVRRVLR